MEMKEKEGTIDGRWRSQAGPGRTLGLPAEGAGSRAMLVLLTTSPMFMVKFYGRPWKGVVARVSPAQSFLRDLLPALQPL